MSPVIVVTGAASGIGRALVRAYLRQGARVAALDLNGAELQKLAAEASAERLRTYQVNVANARDFGAVGRSVRESWGAPAVWINNAGIAVLGSFETVAPADFERVIAVDFFGVVYGTRAALEVMREPEAGTIVNVASINGSVPAPFLTSYIAAKHAVVGFTRSLQLEKDQAQSPVRVMLVCPGWVDTPILGPREGFVFPSWLKWAVTSPEAAAREIISGIEAGKRELTPTWNGKLIRGAHHLAPGVVSLSTRLLSATGWKQLLGLAKIRK